jgi:hypothetical protein
MTHQQPVIIPAPPRPPAGVEPQQYFNEMTRWLENFSRLVAGVHYLRGSGLYLPELDQSAYGLKAGEVWANAGILTWVREGDNGLTGVSATGSVGTLTVTV